MCFCNQHSRGKAVAANHVPQIQCMIVMSHIRHAYAFVTSCKITYARPCFHLFYFISDVWTSTCLKIKQNKCCRKYSFILIHVRCHHSSFLGEGETSVSELVVMVTNSKLQIYNTVLQFNILIKIFEKIPQLNSSQANLLVYTDKITDNVSTDKSKWHYC